MQRLFRVAIICGCLILSVISYHTMRTTFKRRLFMLNNQAHYLSRDGERLDKSQMLPSKAGKQLRGKELTQFICDNISLSAVMMKFLTLEESHTTTETNVKGEMNYKCLCPFHEDGNPSMLVNEGPGYYYCFSCGASGNVISFLAHMNQLSYNKARDQCLDMLESTKWMRQGAKLVNVDDLQIPSYPNLVHHQDTTSPQQARDATYKRLTNKPVSSKTRQVTKAEAEIASVLKASPVSANHMLSATAKKKSKDYSLSAERAKIILKEASKYFTARLLLDPDATFVRNYLKKRGISVATALKYQFGYASCVRQLKRTEKLQGLLVTSNRTSELPVITSQVCKQANITMSSWLNIRYQDLTSYLTTTTLSSGLFAASHEEIVQSGLAINGSAYNDRTTTTTSGISGGSSGKKFLYDRFRYRLMIPIRNIDGEVIAFGGRELHSIQPLDNQTIPIKSEVDNKKATNVAKYVNSPSSAAFQKNQVLFNIDIAQESTKMYNFVIMVEGYFDVISLYEAGIKNVVASMGTSVTLNQLLAAAALSSSGTIVLLLDGDEAGQLASERVLKVLEKFESDLKKTQQLLPPDSLPLGKPPASSKAKPWKKHLDTQPNEAVKSITVRVASLRDVAVFAASNRLVPKSLSSDQVSNADDMYQDLKIKDCADLCEIFTAYDAKKIMRDVVGSATALKTIRWKVLTDSSATPLP